MSADHSLLINWDYM